MSAREQDRAARPSVQTGVPMIQDVAPFIVPSLLVGGPILALAGLAWIGDRLTDRSVKYADRLGRHIPPSERRLLGDNWLERSWTALPSSSHPTKTGAVPLPRSTPKPSKELTHGQQYR